jgi:hypothetical protein
VKAFLNRPLEGDWPYLWIYLKVRRGGRIVSLAAIIAIGVNTDGRRESVRNSVLGRVGHAKVKRSSNRIASWALAMPHSRGGIFHSFAARFNTRNRSFRALSSVGKCPLVLTARRSLAFKLSMAFVTGMKIAVSSSFGWSRFGFGVWCDHPGQGVPGARDVGRPFYSMS